MQEGDCLFCKIAARQMEADLVHDDEQSVAFRDINPQAPVHVLIIPRKHIESLATSTTEDDSLLGYLLAVARKIAESEKLPKNGYRVVVNTGGYAGQTVSHLHLHLLGGRAFRWPPG